MNRRYLGLGALAVVGTLLTGVGPARAQIVFDHNILWDNYYNGVLENIERVIPAKNWAPSWHGGARTVVREEHRV